jgi:transposase
VRKWRARLAADRLDGLCDEPRAGAPRKITDKQVEMVITKTLEERGPGAHAH